MDLSTAAAEGTAGDGGGGGGGGGEVSAPTTSWGTGGGGGYGGGGRVDSLVLQRRLAARGGGADAGWRGLSVSVPYMPGRILAGVLAHCAGGWNLEHEGDLKVYEWRIDVR